MSRMPIYTMPEWRKRLHPFGKIIEGAQNEIHDRMVAMSDEELEQVLSDARQATVINCGSESYKAARFIVFRAPSILRRRKAEEEAV